MPYAEISHEQIFLLFRDKTVMDERGCPKKLGSGLAEIKSRHAWNTALLLTTGILQKGPS
jgi:hypothetical protein